MQYGSKKVFVVLATFLSLLLLWHVSSRYSILDDKLFPPPLDVWYAFIEMRNSGELVRDLAASLYRALLGLTSGVFLGVVLGLLTGYYQYVNSSVGQIMAAFRPVPAIAIIPFVIIWIGIGEVAKSMIVAWAVIFPVWINTHIGVERVEQKILWAAKSLGAKKSQILMYFILPAALPSITAGIRTGVGLAFISLFAAEMAGAVDGIGYRIFTSHLVFRVDKMIVSLVMLGLLGALVDGIIAKSMHKLFPWISANSKK